MQSANMVQIGASLYDMEEFLSLLDVQHQIENIVCNIILDILFNVKNITKL